MRVLRTLAAEDRHHLLTLGMTPVVTAQLDDPYCLSGMHHWLANWGLRALEATTHRAIRCGSSVFASTHEAERALDDFATLWAHGGSPLLRDLIDADTIELLGGPLSHPFQPLLNPRLREFALREGLADAQQRFAHTPAGIWAPECAYAPGMETDYAAAGVGHFMVDGPSLHGDTALGRPVASSDVVAFGRDLQVSYRVWSPKSGYPGHAAYRDFHTYDHSTGLKPARVTGRNVRLGRQSALRPGTRGQRGRRACRRFRRTGAPATDRRERTHRQARTRDRGLRHRTVRALVVRRPGLAGTRAARAARGRGAGRHAVRCGRRRLCRLTRRIAAQFLGFRQGLAGVGRRAGRRPGPVEQRSRRYRADDGGQGAG